MPRTVHRVFRVELGVRLLEWVGEEPGRYALHRGGEATVKTDEAFGVRVYIPLDNTLAPSTHYPVTSSHRLVIMTDGRIRSEVRCRQHWRDGTLNMRCPNHVS
jgi:hypothetical protein